MLDARDRCTAAWCTISRASDGAFLSDAVAKHGSTNYSELVLKGHCHQATTLSHKASGRQKRLLTKRTKVKKPAMSRAENTIVASSVARIKSCFCNEARLCGLPL